MNERRRAQLFRRYPELAAGADLPAGPLGRIKLHFAETFSYWNIALPDEDVAARRRGKICEAGWAIWYLFGKDERGEYLDYYSAHRMTGDDHVRVHEDGQVEYLDAMLEFCLTSPDPVENERLHREHREENQRVARMLEEKGFGITGDEPGAVQINRWLRTEAAGRE